MSTEPPGASTRRAPAGQASVSSAPELVACPECGGTAEILWHRMCASTAGPIDHAFVLCADGHHFLMPVAGVAAGVGPAG